MVVNNDYFEEAAVVLNFIPYPKNKGSLFVILSDGGFYSIDPSCATRVCDLTPFERAVYGVEL
jgi:hypothetical protein